MKESSWLKGVVTMKKFFDRIATILEISFAVKNLRLDQNPRQEDLIAMSEMFGNKSN